MAGADSLPNLLFMNNKRHGGGPAAREKRRGIWRSKTWSGLAHELAHETAAVAASLEERGLEPGDCESLRDAGRKVAAQGPRLFEGPVSGLAGDEPACAFFTSRDLEDVKGVVHRHASPIVRARAMAKRDGMARRLTVSVRNNQRHKYQVGNSTLIHAMKSDA